MATNELINPIENYDEPWEGHTGDEVEVFVKDRLKAHERDIDELKVKVDAKQSESIYTVALKRDGEGDVVSTDGKAVVKLRFSSMETTPDGVRQHYGQEATLTVEYRLNATQQWQSKTLTMQSQPDNSDVYTEVDLGKIVPQGTWYVRMRAKALSTEGVTGMLSLKVSRVNLKLEFANAWQSPVRQQQLDLNFKYDGAVNKTLVVEVSGQGGTGKRRVSYPLGTGVSPDSPQTYTLTDTDADAVKVLTHGVHTVDAWLSLDGTTPVPGTKVEAQVMVVSERSATNKPYIIINNRLKQLDAWTNVNMFDYAVYTPDGNAIPLRFELKNPNTDNVLIDFSEGAVRPGEKRSFRNTVETESTEPLLPLRMTVYSGDVKLCEEVNFTVNNPEGFAPVTGADFIINPKLRTNSEAAPGTIINAASGEAVAATFEGFGFVSDGWTTDKQGVRCLRIPAGRLLTVDYPLFQDFIGDSTQSKSGSLCLDIDFAVHGITDESAPVLRSCVYSTDRRPVGLELSAIEGGLTTNGKVSTLDQYAGWSEKERTHLTMTLNYNAGGTGFNYCRMYVNGVINKEFAYADNDVFVLGSDVPKLILGGTGADIDIYSLRVYRREISARDVEQNHTALIPKAEDKIAFRTANDILLNGKINYAKAATKFNTLKWMGRYPKYRDTKKNLYPGTLVMRQIGKPEYSGTITGLDIAPQGTSAMTYHNMNMQVTFRKGAGGKWTDENGVERGAYIQMGEGMPKAVKNCGKVNYASSMQSHKLGACMLYNDLYKKILGNSSIMQTEGWEDCRVSVNQVPFLLFEQQTEDAEPEFIGLITFGPAKGDKPTFGFDAEKFPDHVAIEGADNDVAVAMGRTPWLDEDVKLDGEDWLYNEIKQFSLMAGDVSKVQPLKDAFNFVYSTYYNIAFHIGNLESLNATAGLDTAKHYWLTAEGANNAQFDLCRYDYLTKRWVHAGMTKNGDGRYSAMNVNTQCGNIAEGVDWDAVNRAFKAKRLEMFKTGVGAHFDVNGLLFQMSFLRLLAASDNWCKNTYWFVDPVTKKIGGYQDDLDTIFLLNNTGKLRKPYDVEEHDLDADGNALWNASGNGLFNAMQLAYGDDLRTMMNTVLTQMQQLGGSPEGCMDKYFYAVQRYFPACAYNETARIFYEQAYVDSKSGKYTNGTDPLEQSNGSSLERERQWMSKRLAYLSSYAAYGEFSCRDGGRSAGSLNFRSVLKRNGTGCNYKVTMTPRISLYPTFGVGQNLKRGTADGQPKRVRQGETFEADMGWADGNTNMFVNGIDHMYSVGNLAEVSLDALGGIAGENLTDFTVQPRTGQKPEFRPASIGTVSAPNLRRIVIRDVPELTGALDLSAQVKLRELDLRGTSLTSVTVPETEELCTLHLPATLTELVLEAQPNLADVTVEGVTRLTVLKLAPNIPGAKAMVEGMAMSNAPLESIALVGINWLNVKTATVLYLARMKMKLGDRFKITGTVKVAAGQTMTLANMQEVSAAFGAFDAADPEQTLAVDYSNCYVVLRDFRISQTSDYFESTGQHTLKPVLTPANANMIRSVAWSIDNDTCATIDPATGVLTVLRVDNDLKPTATVTCTITMLDGTTMERSLTLHFFARQPMKIFDPVYHDGTYGIGNGEGKTLIGICFDVITMQDRTQRRKIFALKDIGTTQWGPTQDLKDGSGTMAMTADIPYFPTYGDWIGDGNPAPASMWDSTAEKWKPKPYGTASADIGDKYLSAEEEMATLEPTYRRTTVYDSDSTLAKPGASQIVPTGTVMTKGQYYTRKLIHDRNRLMGIFNKVIPAAQYLRTEWEDLAIRRPDGYYNSQGYGAFSLCYAYEPALSSVNHIPDLIPEARVHNWYLPTIGELMQVICCLTMIGQAVEGDKLWPLKQLMDQSKIAQTGGNTWSSSEHSNTNALCCSPGGSATSSLKYLTCAVRPVAAF